MPHRSAVLACILLTSLVPAVQAQSGAAEVLTNQTIVQMVTGKLPTDVIQAKIQSSKTNFDVTASGLVSLHTNKVPRDIMKTMVAATPAKGSSEVLNNQAVIQMVTSKLPKDVILAKIQSTKTNFDVSSSGLVSLNTNKVPKDIIKAMMVSGS